MYIELHLILHLSEKNSYLLAIDSIAKSRGMLVKREVASREHNRCQYISWSIF